MEPEIKIPRTRNGKATFQLIIDTTIDLFYKQGYFNTTITDITQKAGIAAGTFYLYFPNKLSLYKYILMEFQHEIRQQIAIKVSAVEGRFEKEKAGIKTFIRYALQNPHAYNIIWESLYIDKQLFIDYYDGFAKRYERGLKQSIKDGEMHDVNTELVSYIFMGVSNFVGLKILLNLGNNNDDVDAIVDEVMDIIRTGIFK
ncbi:TetR/AcrR family transcriptional regulator [Candidatus Xianfuyuplasma coldseepsis]|uniref:TetR/AcrR family transcriptional regulator n=1 Tax=Candidatus Xianfuyuplasma coldseepsis TaxID=2782163 RepID=A0A7L7KN60_9MOLU|nr:TetR/AcrR family transcriptional regulator [Xianfuyuplasma coldseepsis]QMS84190.1 TetR/AcrR family transcriptional regulator [Xianfuyuplasma coldseepsis]